MAKHQFKRQNLVWLVWPPNTCYSRLQAETPKGVIVDIKNGIWTFRGTTRKIGGSILIKNFDDPDSPIGVFDRTKFSHLEALKETIEWVKERNRSYAFDD